MEIRIGSRIVFIGDMNGGIGNNVVTDVEAKWGVYGVKKDGEYLVEKLFWKEVNKERRGGVGVSM